MLRELIIIFQNTMSHLERSLLDLSDTAYKLKRKTAKLKKQMWNCLWWEMTMGNERNGSWFYYGRTTGSRRKRRKENEWRKTHEATNRRTMKSRSIISEFTTTCTTRLNLRNIYQRRTCKPKKLQFQENWIKRLKESRKWLSDTKKCYKFI